MVRHEHSPAPTTAEGGEPPWHVAIYMEIVTVLWVMYLIQEVESGTRFQKKAITE
jgi:hypothetical protein